MVAGAALRTRHAFFLFSFIHCFAQDIVRNVIGCYIIFQEEGQQSILMISSASSGTTRGTKSPQVPFLCRIHTIDSLVDW
jgi:hypothetical protein